MPNSMRRWIDNWNEIIRKVLFADDQLRTLMLIPKNTSILTFVKNYFIRAGYTNMTVRDEKVRIIYGDVGSNDVDAPNIRKQILSFDIYVKEEEQYNADADRLIMRTQLIANRIMELLTSQRYLYGYRFWLNGDRDMGTSVAGYNRYNISFQYMKVM